MSKGVTVPMDGVSSVTVDDSGDEEATRRTRTSRREHPYRSIVLKMSTLSHGKLRAGMISYDKLRYSPNPWLTS
jgi:hypothetical protein